jgi:hypothetical protein
MPWPPEPSFKVALTLCYATMQTDYSAAITAMVAIGLALTAGVVYVLSRPSDLNNTKS